MLTIHIHTNTIVIVYTIFTFKFYPLHFMTLSVLLQYKTHHCKPLCRVKNFFTGTNVDVHAPLSQNLDGIKV